MNEDEWAKQLELAIKQSLETATTHQNTTTTSTETGEQKDLSKELQLQLDLALAQSLQSETGPANKDATMTKQEELDLMLAMKLQEGIYAEEFKEKPPPPPATYTPTFSFGSGSPAPLFHLQKHDPSDLPPTPEAVKRIVSDLKEVMGSQNRYIHVAPDEDDVTHVQALIVGPPDTPYSNGFFHFDMLYPHDYPWRPPKVQLVTTDSGRVRFNPNLYSNGKVCLSILGTWSGPGWTQIQTMLSTLLSIQSLMNSSPYHNEPGYESERKSGDIEKYNDCIRHETLRVAVCGMIETPTCGDLFREAMEEIFLEKFEEYIQVCHKYQHMDGKPMEDPFGEKRGIFGYKKIETRLIEIKGKLEAKKKEESEKPTPMDESPFTAPPSSTTTTTVTTTVTEESSTTSAPMELSEGITSTTTATTSTTSVGGGEGSVGGGDPFAIPNLEQFNAILFDPDSKKQFDVDAELAKKLQEEMYAEESAKQASYTHYGGGGGWGRGIGGHKKPPPSDYTRNFVPVKAPPLHELMKSSEKESDKDFDPDLVCLICHQSPKEYVILPACQQPHVYCMNCANKMIKQAPAAAAASRFNYSKKPAKRSNSQTIQCVLCSAVSNLDPSGGLASLRRRKKRKLEGSQRGKCAEHKEDYCMYCFNDNQLICYICASSSHARHELEALDVAQKRLTPALKNQMKTLQQKKHKFEEFSDSVEKQKPQIYQGAQTALQEVRDKMAAIRKIVDDKEKELEESIRRMEETKKNSVQSEINKANEKVQTINQCLGALSHALDDQKEPLDALLAVEEMEEQIRHSCAMIDPDAKSKWFTMPSVNTAFVEQAFNALKYTEKRHLHGMYPPMVGEEEYSGEEEVVDDIYY